MILAHARTLGTFSSVSLADIVDGNIYPVEMYEATRLVVQYIFVL